MLNPDLTDFKIWYSKLENEQQVDRCSGLVKRFIDKKDEMREFNIL
jgi:hypothetical protein